MKKNKIFGVLSLALVGVFGLASCAPSVVTADEAKQAVATMKKAYEDGEVKASNELSVTISTASSSTQGTNKRESAATASAMVNLEKHQAYAKVTSGKDSVLEIWSYVDNGNLITATIVGTTKTYSSVPVAADKIDVEFNKTYAAGLVEEYNGVEGVEIAEDQLRTGMTTDESSLKAEFGENAKIELGVEYRSNMKDNLYITYSASVSGATNDDATGISYKSALTLKIDEYILSEYSVSESSSGKIAGIETSQEISQSITVKKSAKISTPNLNDFTKGVIIMPELPF